MLDDYENEMEKNPVMRKWPGLRSRSVVRLILVVLALGMAGSILLGFDGSRDTSGNLDADRGLGLWPPPPHSMKALVEGADVIAVGRITAVTDEHEMGPYADNSIRPDAPPDEPAPANATATPTLPGVHVTLYEVAIDQLLLGDGRVAEGGSLRFLEAGSAEADAAFMDSKPMPQPGDRFLFALVLNPDGANYSAGRWGLIDIQGDAVAYADWERTPVDFAGELAPAEFIDAVREEADVDGQR